MSESSGKLRGPIAWMAHNSVAANLVMACCIVGGLLMLFKIRMEVFPELTLDVVEVTVSYPGASPEEVEQGVVLAIEEQVRGIDGVKKVRSTANEGSCTVSIEVVEGEDVQQVTADVQSAVDRIRTFPEDAEEPQVAIESHRRGVMEIIIFGDTTQPVLLNLSERLRDQLLQDPEITQVDVQGLPDLEIEVAVPEGNLRRYGLTMQEIADRIANASLDIPGGAIKTHAGEILIRLTERRDFGKEFGALPIISNADGSQVLLRDIATVTDGFEDADRYATWDGKPAVMIEVYRIGDQTPMSVAKAARAHLADFAAELPPGIGATVRNDRSEHFAERIRLLVRNGMLGLILVLLSLGIFLELRLAFWVMLGIPISFLGSFLFLPSTGVSINMMSLFAYIIALGIVVDDAIVVGENVYHLHQEGAPFKEAAVRGARQVARPVVFSILTNCVAFLPLYFIPGVMGKIFYQIPVVVCLVFMISLFESLFILPAHLAHQKNIRGRGGPLHRAQQWFSDSFRGWIQHLYGPFLERLLAWRYLTVAVGVAILAVALAYALSGRMRFDQFPVVESDFSRAQVTLPFGSPIEKTEAVMRRLLAAAQEVVEESGHPELLEGIFTDIGRGGPHVLRMDVNLAPPEIRDKIMSTQTFTELWRAKVGELVGVESMRIQSDAGGPGSGRGITVQLSHRDLDVLREASSELADDLLSYDQVKDADDGFQPGKPQLDFTLTPLGRSVGLTARSVARQLRNAFYGAEAIRQQRGRQEIRVQVRLPEGERVSEQNLVDMMLRTPAGRDVPLREAVDIHRGRAYMGIDRVDGRRVVEVTGDVTPRSAAGEVLSDMRQTVLPGVLDRYPGLSYSFEGRQAEMRESLMSLKISFVIALLVIYALLAVPFRSYVQPLIILVSIPFGVVGAIVGHLLMGYNLSIPSVLGMVALAGVVINDALVLIDFTNERRRELGETPFVAIHAAAIQRFRPILLTTLTTFCGLAPMIVERSRQARFLIPMAISLGFGILFGTAITLGLIPCLYLAVEDVRKLFGKRSDTSPKAK